MFLRASNPIESPIILPCLPISAWRIFLFSSSWAQFPSPLAARDYERPLRQSHCDPSDSVASLRHRRRGDRGVDPIGLRDRGVVGRGAESRRRAGNTSVFSCASRCFPRSSHRIRFPSAERASSVPSSAVMFLTSKTGLISTRSSELRRSVSAMTSMIK